MKTSSAKQKGRKLQQYVRDTILGVFPELHPDDVRSTSMGAQGEDIQLSPAARKLLPVTIEAKARRSITVGRWFEQAEEHSIGLKDNTLSPIVVMKEDRKKPLVLLDFDVFMSLMRNNSYYAQDYLKQQQEISKKAKELKND